MWSMIETQQIIVLLIMFKIDAPANAVAFFAQILAIAAFDFFEVEPATNYLLKLEPTGALTDKFDQLGMESLYFVNNLGSYSLFYTVYFTMLLVVPCIGTVCRTSKNVKRNK